MPKKCGSCGKSYSSISEEINDMPCIRNIGISINDEYFIDIESIINMDNEELIRNGISKDKVLEFLDLLAADNQMYESYNNSLKTLIKTY